jgi:hypothetical protein
MYSTVPSLVKEIALFVEFDNGSTFNPPIDLRKYAQLSALHSPKNFFKLDKLVGEAQRTGDNAKLKFLLNRIRLICFNGNKRIRMSLRSVEWDPLERWHNDKIRTSQTIALYNLEDF